MLNLSPVGCLAVASSLLVIFLLFKILSASRSPLHALPGPERASLLLGNVEQANIFAGVERNFTEEWTDTYGGVVRVHGLLGTQPELCVSDPEFLYHVYVSNEDSWPKPEMFNHYGDILLGPGVLTARGDDHRRQRKILNPMFTADNMRALVPGMHDVAHKLSQKLSKLISSQDTSSTAVVDVLKLSSATAIDIICSAGLGYDFDALGTENAYTRAIKHIQLTTGEILLTIPFLKPLSYLGPYSFRSWVMDTFCPFLGAFGRSVLKLRHILRTMDDTAREVYRDRQAFIASEDALEGPTQFSRTDVLSNLVRATSGDSGTMLDEKEAVSHINTLVFAGFETTSSAISHTLDILATRQELQEQLRTEILEARGSMSMEDLGYDTIMGLPLLDCVVREMLRLYSPVSVATRQSGVDSVVPLASPIKSADGKTEIKEIFVPKNTTIHASIAGLNRSKAIWGDDAKEFKPERWLREGGPIDAASKSTFARIPSVFSSVMSFSGGPRGCIGWRMAVLELKLVLTVLLPRFRFQHKNDLEIRWIYSAISVPTVVGDKATGPQLPLIVSEIASP